MLEESAKKHGPFIRDFKLLRIVRIWYGVNVKFSMALCNDIRDHLDANCEVCMSFGFNLMGYVDLSDMRINAVILRERFYTFIDYTQTICEHIQFVKAQLAARIIMDMK